ncbi:MAG: ThuA domain-containing protein [Saprospiraceae bacterium]|nr:ThuA domain-containing protein [Saprospiraceae bacterium]
MKQSFLLLFCLSVFLISCSKKQEGTPRVLLFSKTADFVHESIPEGIAAIQKLGAENGFEVDTTSDASVFNDDSLKKYGALIFLNTTGDILDFRQGPALERYIQSGGGFVGVHAAADAEYDWKWYGDLVGAYFQSHPEIQEADFKVLDKKFAATSFLTEDVWKRTDELYNYKKINPDLKVVLALDEKSYEGGENGENHPIAWYHDYDGGRAFYTGLGHTKESYVEENFLKHLLGGIQYAIGDNEVLNYGKAKTQYPPEQDRFSKTILSYGGFYEPTEMTILPNLDILITQRRGEIMHYSQETKTLKQVGFLDVYFESSVPGVNAEDGLLGIAKDPNFEKNHWVYMYYSPKDTTLNRLSRFTFEKDTIDLASEKTILEFYVQRQICCHTGGSIAFGPDGLLYLSTGDNSTPFNERGAPFVNSGFAPLNDLPGKDQYDARRSSANTNDLRGKILRIKIKDDATYDIPEGNLFPKGTAKTRPEIYTMGHRNPYRISVDQKNGYLYWGDIGPDAAKDSLETRGPKGYDEINQARKAGNYGWPLFAGPNVAYRKYDYATGISGDLFDPAKPMNESKNNTGLVELPAAQPAFMWYSYDKSHEFPQLGTGGKNPMAGPIYYKDMYPKETRLPDYYDNKVIIYEWVRNWIKAVTLDKDGNFEKMEPLFDGIKLNNCIDMEMGPDGKLYLLEYGSGWFLKNDNSGLSRIDFNTGNRPPSINELTTDKTSGVLPFTVTAKVKAEDKDGDEITYVWDFGDGKEIESKSDSMTHTYDKIGDYNINVTVKDKSGAGTLSENIAVYAGNASPELKIALTGGNRTFFVPGQPLSYAVSVNDTEGATQIDPENLKVTVNYMEGFDLAAVGQGHFQGTTGGKGKSLTERLDCKSCHKAEEKSIGPSYLDISKKYDGQPKADGSIAKSIINGSQGAWGEAQMPAHPSLDPDDAAAIAKYILSLAADGKDLALLPQAGKVVPPKETKSTATMIMSAVYTDRGGEGIKPMTGKTTMYLPGNELKLSGKEDKSEFTMANMRGTSMMVFPIKEGYFATDMIDLTGIKRIHLSTFYRNEPKIAMAIEARLDAVDGPLLGTGKMVKVKNETNRGDIFISLKSTTDGKDHKVFFVYKPIEILTEAPGVSIRSIVFE